jgi:hypothetical protein
MMLGQQPSAFCVRGVQKFTRSKIPSDPSRAAYARDEPARDTYLLYVGFAPLLIYWNAPSNYYGKMTAVNHAVFHRDETPAGPHCVPGRLLVSKALAPHRYWTPLAAELRQTAFSGITFAHP